MADQRTRTQVALRGELCRDLLSMVAAGTTVSEAAVRIISELLNAADGTLSIRQDEGVFVFEQPEPIARQVPNPKLFQ
jgi:hypothetical protein